MADYALAAGGLVVRTSDNAFIPNDPQNGDRQTYEAWLANGGVPGNPPAPQLTAANYQAAIEAHVDVTARERNYSGAASCASYVASTVPGWAAEAAAFIAWRDQVYLESFEALAAVERGGEPPTLEAFLASLPAIAWPA